MRGMLTLDESVVLTEVQCVRVKVRTRRKIKTDGLGEVSEYRSVHGTLYITSDNFGPTLLSPRCDE